MQRPFRAHAARLAGIFGAISFIGIGAIEAQQSFSTDHYVINFNPGTEGTARRVAEVAEEVFPHLAAAYDYYSVYEPIYINVLDNTDFGNGSANEYTGTVTIWASNLDWEIRGDHDWIKNVLTHEIAHIMTLQRARKNWPFRYALFSVSRFDSNPDISFTLPVYYLSTPTWWVEGIAQFAPYQLGYDSWDSHRDMILRMSVIEDDLHTYNEMGTLLNRLGGYRAEQVYNQGFALLVYIESQYGADKVESLQNHVGSISFEPAIRQVLGISAEQLYDDWVTHLKDSYAQQVAEIRRDGFYEGQALDELNGGVLDYHPAYSPDGTKLAYIGTKDRDFRSAQLQIYDFETGEGKELKGRVDTRISWSPDGEEVLFLRNKRGFNDLYVYNIAEDEERRITARLRARDPSYSPDGDRIVFVRNEDGTSNLCTIDHDGKGLRYLTNNNDGTQIYAPRWSPNGEWILFSIFKGDDRDIAMMRADSPPRAKKWGIRDRTEVPDSLNVFPDSLAFPHPDTSGFTPMLASVNDERDPYWLPDGSGFVFASDLGGVFNIHRYRLESGTVDRLTNVLGGAFTPTVSADGDRLTYSSYHSNNWELFEVDLESRGDGEPVTWDPLIARDYQSRYDGPPLSKEYDLGRARGKRVADVIPIFQAGPTAIGNRFGLNQISGGFQVSARPILSGGDALTAWGVLGKNFREDTDLNSDFGASYQRRVFPAAAGNQTFRPLFFAAVRRREIDSIQNAVTQNIADTSATVTFYPVASDTSDLLIPESTQYFYSRTTQKDLLKSVFNTLSLGVQMPLSRRQMLFASYLNRDYIEDWSVQRVRRQTDIFLVQDGVDITQSLTSSVVHEDTVFIGRNDPLKRYNDLEFFHSHDLTLAWQYQNVKSSTDLLITPTGRGVTLIYRYMKPTLVDSLLQATPVAGEVPGDEFLPVKTSFTINEYVGAYTESIGLPYHNSIYLQAIGAYRNLRLKPRVAGPDGGIFEGRFYWPLRYWIGGSNFLSGYPFFTANGSKLLYGRAAYRFPIFQRLNLGFFNFNAAKLYTELFAETAAVGNSNKLHLDDFSTDDFLSDIGGELRLQLFTFYNLPMQAFFQVAHPLNRQRELNWRQSDRYRQLGFVSVQAAHRRQQELQSNPARDATEEDELDRLDAVDRFPRIDRFRYYFGLGFVSRGLF